MCKIYSAYSALLDLLAPAVPCLERPKGSPIVCPSFYLGIACKYGGGSGGSLNACPDGLGQLFWEEFI